MYMSERELNRMSLFNVLANQNKRKLENGNIMDFY